MKRIVLQLDERMRPAATRLDSMARTLPADPAPGNAAVTTEPAFVGTHTPTDVPARRPPELSP